jgi:hypothetical protein
MNTALFVIGMIVAVLALSCMIIEIVKLFNGKIRYQ